PSAAALARSIVQATEYTHDNPNEAAKVFAKYSPKISPEDLRKLYATLTYTHHPTNVDLQQEIAFYADDFRRIS
ncbi:ABC transporter substrate-binding protein, partial [Escherichia coli]|nr:ABC transporter substrate-binding protein [Escherichia coli]